jgi:hypothetical protein
MANTSPLDNAPHPVLFGGNLYASPALAGLT